jgi:D-tagatose-1,6-bisphosphate aldolase subunit GatZ/KbaZ
MQVLDEPCWRSPNTGQALSGQQREQRLLRRYGLSDRCRYYWGEAAVVAAVEADRQSGCAGDSAVAAQPAPAGAVSEVLQGQLAQRATPCSNTKSAACWRSTRAPATATQPQPITLLLAALLHLLSCLFDRFTANHATYQPTPRLDFAGAHSTARCRSTNWWNRWACPR